jgi:hypothetical protein
MMMHPYKIQLVQVLTAANKQWRHKFWLDFLQFMQQ